MRVRTHVNDIYTTRASTCEWVLHGCMVMYIGEYDACMSYREALKSLMDDLRNDNVIISGIEIQAESNKMATVLVRQRGNVHTLLYTLEGAP